MKNTLIDLEEAQETISAFFGGMFFIE